MIKGLLFLLFIVLSSSQITPTWSQSPRFDAGDVIMVNNHLSTTWTTNFTVTYHLGKQLTTPWVGLSIRQLRIASNAGQIKFRTNLLNLPSSTNFVVNVDVLTPTQIWYLKVRYLAYDGGFSQFSTFNLQYKKYTTGGAAGSDINTIDRGLGSPRTQTFSTGINVATAANRHIMVAFTVGFIGTFNTTNFQGNVTQKLDVNTVKLDVTVSAQTLITEISFYVFVADIDSLLTNCWVFAQTQVTKSVRGVQTTFYNPARAPFDYNYISGLRSFSLQHNMQYNFTISGLVFYTYTNSYHNDVRHLNIWARFCPSPYIVFNKVDFLCYAACPAGTYLVVVDTLCLPCHYTCATCSTSTTCDTCPSFRTLNAGTGLCDCIDYYYQLNKVCVQCHYSCKKCTYSGQYFNCMACDINMFRTPASPTNSTCNCSDGYTDAGVTMCKQICGDGKVYTGGCDDGNLYQGDGCSSVCSVQPNFQCDNPTPPANTPASSCYYIGNMAIDVVRIQKHPEKNMATFYLNITPYSPIFGQLGSQNMVTNVTGAYFISVFKFGDLIAYNITYNQSFEGETIMFGLKPSATGPLSRFFPKNDTFAAYCSNGLVLNYYSTTHYLQSATFGNACYILGFVFSVIGAILCFGDWKQLGLEMMFSLQICYMIFLAFTFYNPYITNVLSFRNVMGWNGYVLPRQTLPYHSVPILEHMGYSVAFQNNFNVMAVFPGTALLLYAVYRGFMYRHQKRRLSGETSKDFEQTMAGKILSYFNFELFVYWMLFNMQQILMSTVIQSQYIKNGAIYIFIVLCLIGIIISIVALFLRPKSMKSFRENLFHKSYGNKTFLAVLISVIFMNLILLLTVLVTKYIFYAMFFPPLVIGIYVIARRPFKLMWNNVRLFIIQICLIVSITLIVVMINISYEDGHLLVIGVMSCMVLIALVTVISWIIDIVKKICRLTRQEDYQESSKKTVKQEQSINEKVRQAGFALVHGNTKGSIPTVYQMGENPTPKNRNQLSKFKSPRQPVSSKRNFDEEVSKKYDNSKIKSTQKPKPAEEVLRSKSKDKSNPNLGSQRPNNIQEGKNNREDTLQRIQPSPRSPRKKRANPYQQILEQTANRYKN